jgi:hypothetical protein
VSSFLKPKSIIMGIDEVNPFSLALCGDLGRWKHELDDVFFKQKIY